MAMLIFAASFILLFCGSKSEENSPIVKIPLGKVKGVLRESYGSRQYSAFEGIPFAKPPVGHRRFEVAEPIEPWDGIWDSRFPTICSQHIYFPGYNITVGVEDCLHINVYVPRENPSSNFDLEVLVHIHGGAFVMGDGLMVKPTFLMDHEIIVVTFNYRLGVLGFLSTEDDVVPGNMGMKDQVLALKWVQKNIRSFGGNPKAVTISGVSAGGASTHLHYFSDLSKNLFHRGIAHCGVALNPWVLTENSLERAKFLAQAVGCPSTSNKLMVKCFKERPVGQLMDKLVSFYGYNTLPLTPFGPVVEKGGLNPFLKDQPYQLLKTKQVLDVPLLASHATHEGLLPARFFINDLGTIDERWEDIAPILLDFNDTLPASERKSVSKKIKDFYFGENQAITKEQYPKLVELFGDRLFYVGAEEALLLQAGTVKSPIYYYRFGYLGDNNAEQMVGHAEDTQYFFGKLFPTPANLTIDELKMRSIMVEMLVAYTKTGVPALRGIIWPFVDGDKLNHVEIMGLERQFFKIRKPSQVYPTEFWNSLGLAENRNLLNTKDEL